MNVHYFIFLFFFLSSTLPAFGDADVIRCTFDQGAKNPITYVTSMDWYGHFVTKGAFEGKNFECSYRVKNFQYKSKGVIPTVEFLLSKNQCKVFPVDSSQHLRKTVSLTVFKKGKSFKCKEDLLLSYPSGEDSHPLYDGKVVAGLSEKYKRRIWP